jgi:hypothetical protein
MKAKEKKRRNEATVDPILFAATVPSRKPTAKDLADAAERPDDAIEPKKQPSMEKILDDP